MKKSFITKSINIVIISLLLLLFSGVMRHVNSQNVNSESCATYSFQLGKDKFCLSLDIRYASEKKQAIANGKDSVKIGAQLNKHAPQQIKLHLLEQGVGNLDSRDVIIPKGSIKSQTPATLTSTIAGKSTINYHLLLPGGRWIDGKSFTVDFIEPLSILMEASPPETMFLGNMLKSGITLSLVDRNEQLTTLSEQRQIQLSVIKGSGTFLENGEHKNNLTLVIGSGQSSASTVFVPNQSGKVTIKASSPNMQSVTTELKFLNPLVPLILAGALGSLAALLNNLSKGDQQKSWGITLPLGILSGIVASFFALFFASFNPAFDQSWAFLMALGLSVLGGWVGPELTFKFILNKFISPPSGSSHEGED